MLEAVKAEVATLLRQIEAALNEPGYETSRGGQWTAAVQRHLRKTT
jgi:hypothetical protein